jgi:hypothetical protein
MKNKSVIDQGLVIWTYGPNKYRYKRIEELPSKFLLWAAENCQNSKLAAAADSEWQFREKYNRHLEEEENE